MKSLKETLKESLLSDTDVILTQCEDYIKQQEKKKSKFLKAIGSDSNYKKIGAYKISKFIKIDDVRDILNLLGFDANSIELRIYDNSSPSTRIPEWIFGIRIDDLYNYVLVDETRITDAKVFIKELIKPLTTDIDTFKKVLNNMIKLNKQHIHINDLLK